MNAQKMKWSCTTIGRCISAVSGFYRIQDDSVFTCIRLREDGSYATRKVYTKKYRQFDNIPGPAVVDADAMDTN
jgi:hypothetical protein